MLSMNLRLRLMSAKVSIEFLLWPPSHMKGKCCEAAKLCASFTCQRVSTLFQFWVVSIRINSQVRVCTTTILRLIRFIADEANLHWYELIMWWEKDNGRFVWCLQVRGGIGKITCWFWRRKTVLYNLTGSGWANGNGEMILFYVNKKKLTSLHDLLVSVTVL